MMMPRIEARAQLNLIEAAALAMGSSQDRARNERIDAIRAQARGELPQGETKPRRATRSQLAEMGIAMTVVGPDGKPIAEGAGDV